MMEYKVAVSVADVMRCAEANWNGGIGVRGK